MAVPRQPPWLNIPPDSPLLHPRTLQVATIELRRCPDCGMDIDIFYTYEKTTLGIGTLFGQDELDALLRLCFDRRMPETSFRHLVNEAEKLRRHLPPKASDHANYELRTASAELVDALRELLVSLAIL